MTTDKHACEIYACTTHFLSNRSKIHVYFLIRRTTSEYLTHIVYSQTTTVFPRIDAPSLYYRPEASIKGNTVNTSHILRWDGLCKNVNGFHLYVLSPCRCHSFRRWCSPCDAIYCTCHFAKVGHITNVLQHFIHYIKHFALQCTKCAVLQLSN